MILRRLSESDNKDKVCKKCGKFPCECECLNEDKSLQELIDDSENPDVAEQPDENKAVAGDTFLKGLEQGIDVATGEVAKPEGNKEPIVEENAFLDLINGLIQQEWNFISSLNGVLATFDYQFKDENKEEILSIIKQISDDTTINIGMLHKASELISIKSSSLLSAGEEKAEEIIEG